jgi:hypothetical protein
MKPGVSERLGVLNIDEPMSPGERPENVGPGPAQDPNRNSGSFFAPLTLIRLR